MSKQTETMTATMITLSDRRFSPWRLGRLAFLAAAACVAVAALGPGSALADVGITRFDAR